MKWSGISPYFAGLWLAETVLPWMYLRVHCKRPCRRQVRRGRRPVADRLLTDLRPILLESGCGYHWKLVCDWSITDQRLVGNLSATSMQLVGNLSATCSKTWLRLIWSQRGPRLIPNFSATSPGTIRDLIATSAISGNCQSQRSQSGCKVCVTKAFTSIIMSLHTMTPHESRMCPMDLGWKSQKSRSQGSDYWK